MSLLILKHDAEKNIRSMSGHFTFFSNSIFFYSLPFLNSSANQIYFSPKHFASTVIQQHQNHLSETQCPIHFHISPLVIRSLQTAAAQLF